MNIILTNCRSKIFWKLICYLSFLGKPDVVFSEDEEFKRVSFDKFATLKPAFQKNNGKSLLVYLHSKS